MKAPSALLAFSILITAPLCGQEEKPAPSAPPAEAAPAGEAAPSPAEPAPAEAPAAPVPAPAAGEAPAKEAPMPADRSSAPLPTAPGAPAEPEPSLIPESPTPMEKPAGSALPSGPKEEKKGGDKKSKTEAAEEDLQQRIRFRETRVRALADPGVQAEWQHAEKARTEYARREALKRYYTQLYGRMEKLDATLKKQIDLHRQISIRRLEQTRIAPTEPFEPGERSVDRTVGASAYGD